MLISLETLSLYLPAVLALNLTPGNDMLFCINQGIRNGPRAGIAASAGIAAGSVVHTLAAAVGLAAAMAAHPIAFGLVRWAGVAWLVWLALQAFRQPVTPELVGYESTTRLFQVFRQGLLVNVLNPKVAIFVLAFVPQFVDPAAGSTGGQFLLLGLLLNLFGIPINTAAGVFAGTIGKALISRPWLARTLQYTTGTVFALLAIRLATQTQLETA